MSVEQLFNDPSTVVSDMLEGLASIEPLTLLTDDGGLRLIARRTWNRDHVSVLSGGGAGHEPAHAGFVGEGMLTAAVSGDVFASPSVEAVLTGIRHVTGPAGCLVVVKSYTGDRLNFGLAAERARSEGLRVATVTVADDVALAGSARGLAGTVLVHKLAGHLAGQGVALAELAARVQAFADTLGTLGLALGPCHIPGRASWSPARRAQSSPTSGAPGSSPARRAPDEPRGAELGLGIHNEPGAKSIQVQSARDAMAQVLEPLRARVRAERLVVLLNDLGGCSPQELLVLTRELCTQLPGIVRLVRPARLMTSIDMRGFSVTLAPADDALLAALDAPTSAAAWPGTLVPHAPEHVHLAPAATEAAVYPQDPAVSALVARGCQALIDAREALDALDAKVGDGDAGSTFATGARAVQAALAAGELPTAEPAALARAVGLLLGRVMGGSSGVLLSIAFTATSAALAEGSWATAFASGLERMQHYGGARAGDRTMLDALLPASQAGDLRGAALAARAGADATASMHRARAGRSSYVPEAALAGVVDPGAEAVARFFAAAAG